MDIVQEIIKKMKYIDCYMVDMLIRMNLVKDLYQNL